MSDQIVIRGIRGVGFHGVFEQERQNGQEFVVDVEVETDFSTALRSDAIEDTLNYAVIADIAFQKITGEPFQLIESLADAIAQEILNFPMVISISVTVHKPYAPLEVPFENVSVVRSLP